MFTSHGSEKEDNGESIMHVVRRFTLALIAWTALSITVSAQTGDLARGERMFRTCAPCHSLESNRNMTGPSLAELWNRTADGLSSFDRYSPALKSSGIIWQDNTLDEWLKDPQHVVPGNAMTFAGIEDTGQRADLLAFLKDATQPGHAPATTAQRGGMMGMMGGGAVPNLKQLDPDELVQKITHC